MPHWDTVHDGTSTIGVDKKPPSVTGGLLHKSTDRYVDPRLAGLFRRSYRESGATRAVDRLISIIGRGLYVYLGPQTQR